MGLVVFGLDATTRTGLWRQRATIGDNDFGNLRDGHHHGERLGALHVGLVLRRGDAALYGGCTFPLKASSPVLVTWQERQSNCLLWGLVPAILL